MNPLIAALRYLYPVMCVFIPCILYQIILHRRWPHHEKLVKGSLVWRNMFVLYLFLVMRAVGMGSLWDIRAYGLVLQWDQINLAPFGSDGVLTYLLNIVLFMPMGFLLPLIWGRCRKLAYAASLGFLFSAAIELGQLFNHRLTDIDDILMNTLGTAVGFGVWFGLNKWLRRKPMEENIFPDRPAVYLALTVLGTFFLYNWRWTVLLYR